MHYPINTSESIFDPTKISAVDTVANLITRDMDLMKHI